MLELKRFAHTSGLHHTIPGFPTPIRPGTATKTTWTIIGVSRLREKSTNLAITLKGSTRSSALLTGTNTGMNNEEMEHLLETFNQMFPSSFPLV